MKISEFKRCMQCGLGRCALELKTTEDINKYKKVVLWGCLRNLSFDAQCEGTRAQYMYYLASQFKDNDYFIDPTIEKFEKLPKQRDWEYSHFSELLSLFALNGSQKAYNALYKKYNALYQTLLTKNKCTAYDYNRDNFERICVSLTSLDGFDAFKTIARDMGTLFLVKKHYSGLDFDWFYSNSENEFGYKKINSYLNKKSKSSDEIQEFYKGFIENNEQYKGQIYKPRAVPTALELAEKAENRTINHRDKVLFIRNAPYEEKVKFAQMTIDVQDYSKKADYLSVFYKGGFPLSCSYLIEYIKSDNCKLRNTAYDVLSESKDTVIRDFALHLIKNDIKKPDAICMLINNYTKADKSILFSALEAVPVTYSNNSCWHGIVCTIIDAFEAKAKLPKELLFYVYNNSLCSCCRESAVKIMAKHRWLTPEIIRECYYDSNSDIADYVRRYYPLAKQNES